MRRVIVTLLVVALITLAGCTSGTGMSVDEAVDGSEAVSDVTLSNENGQVYLNIYVNETVHQNDEYCQFNPATKITTCYDDWQEVDVTEVTVVRDGTIGHFENESLNGEKLRIPIEWESGEYQIQFTSSHGTTTFGVAIVEDGDEIRIGGAGYSDTL